MPTLIRELPTSEQPAYRAATYGAAGLSTAELLTLLAGNRISDTGASILAAAGSIGGIARLSAEEMANLPGVGQANAVKLQAAVELGRRMQTEHKDTLDRVQIRCPADAANLLIGKYGDQEQEVFVTLMLDTKNRVMGEEVVYKGANNMILIRNADVLRTAVRRGASSIVVAHCHPSGDPTPSPEDVQATRSLKSACDLIDIDLLDHIILGRGRWISLKERGLGF